MTEPNKPVGDSESPSREGIQEQSVIPRIHQESSDVAETVKQVLDPLQTLKQWRETKPGDSSESAERISPFDYETNEIAKHAKHGVPIRRRDLRHSTGIQAVVLAYEEFEAIRDDLEDQEMEMRLAYIDRSGQRVAITEDSFSEGGVFVLLPDAVGEEEGKSA